MKIGRLLTPMLVGLIVLAGCDFSLPWELVIPTPKTEPTMDVYLTPETVSVVEEQPVANAEDAFEAQVRYIIADIQLGSVDGYYRGFLDQPAVADAISRWDAGIRVQNITDFERIINGDAGWQVVYAGTTTLINGMDVILTEGEAPQVSYYCDNPYWPIAEGATWTYIGTSGPRSGQYQTWTVDSIVDYGSYAEFSIQVCDSAGISQVYNGGAFQSFQLPSQSNLIEGNSFGSLLETGLVIVGGFGNITVPLGDFEAVTISTHHGEGPALTWSYALGIGPVAFPLFENGYNSPGSIFGLVSYSIP
jgi:hypothetical protein